MTTADPERRERTVPALPRAGDQSTGEPRTPRPGPRAPQSVLWTIVAAQALWLGVLMSRGWYYQDDLTLLAQAHQHAFGLGYLTEPFNDHLTPGLRLGFWLLEPLGLSAYWPTVVVRVLMQAASTLLLDRLMVRLAGRTWLGLGVLAGYAFSPLLLGMLWLTVAATALPAQLLVLFGYLAQVRYIRGGQLRYAAAAGFAFGLAATFLELSGIAFVLLIPLVLGYVYEGRTVRARVAGLGRQYRGWLVAVAPLAAFATWYAVGGYGRTAQATHVGTLGNFGWLQWSRTIAPLSLGGPLRWFAAPGVFVSASDPSRAVVWSAQAICLIAVVASLVVVGARAIVAWLLPIGFTVLCSAVLTIGRFHEFGYLSARVVVYVFGAAVPCALAVLLAFHRPARKSRSTPSRRRRVRPPRIIAIALLATAVAGGVASAVTFTDRWAENPTRDYLDTLRRQLGEGPTAHLFDTPLPLNVLPYVEPNRYLSDVVPLLDARAVFNSGSPEIVDQAGHIVAATFLLAAGLPAADPTRFCTYLVRGRDVRVWRLTHPVNANEWFLRLDYFQQHASVVHVELLDAGGRATAPVSGTRVVLGSTLATTYLRFPSVAPAAVRVSSESLATNVCLTGVQVGYPFPAKAAK